MQKFLQQFSTPCPIAYVLGLYVQKKKNVPGLKENTFFEPTAGNGMLTIAFKNSLNEVSVNELDGIRFDNLKRMNFFEATNEDILKANIREKHYYGVIANPPFAQVDKPLIIKGYLDNYGELTYKFDRLDHV